MKRGEYMFWFAQNWLGFPGCEAFSNKMVHVLDKLGRFCHPDIKNPFVFFCHLPSSSKNLWALGEFASSVMCSETGIFL